MDGNDSYLIKVKGHISSKRIGFQEDMAVILEDGNTSIVLRRCDQAKLHSALCRIRDLGLILIQVIKLSE